MAASEGEWDVPPELMLLVPGAPAAGDAKLDAQRRRQARRAAAAGLAVAFAICCVAALFKAEAGGLGGGAEAAADVDVDAGLRLLTSAKVPIITVNTYTQNLSIPMPGAPGRNFINVGANLTWAGWNGRAKMYVEGLRKHFGDAPERVVIIADGTDVLSGGCSDADLLSYYKRTVAASNGTKVVYGAQMREFPPLPKHLDTYKELRGRARAVKRAFGLGATPYAKFLNRTACSHDHWHHPCWPANDHLNAGFVMGPAGELADIYGALLEMPDEEVMGKHGWNDQKGLSVYMLKHSAKITLDYSSSLVLNMVHTMPFKGLLTVEGGRVHNSVTGQTACFVHGNGDGFDKWTELSQRLEVHTKRS